MMKQTKYLVKLTEINKDDFGFLVTTVDTI